jgi:predicted nucleotidyltransferase
MTSKVIQADKTLKKIVSQIVHIANPDKIILFGSRATGKAKKESDYDICVLKKYVKRKRKLSQKIRTKLDVFAPIDIIVNTPKQFEELKGKWYLIYHDIEQYGKVLYEKG